MPGLLSRERTIAGPGFDRWLVPPAALAIHLSIGMAYGFSVFWLPLGRAVGIAAPVACAPDLGFFARLTATSCDWKVTWLGVLYTLFFVFLGSSAALFGSWLERAGPRKAGVVAALCWSGGLFLSSLGIHLHQIWLLWLGAGVIGGIGLGLGYISPVSTLIKWFPDRRGMATGLAIMGFGGGAMIGAPLADRLMNFFRTESSVGVTETFLVMGLLYLVAMLAGAFGYRVPPDGWKPEGWTPPPSTNAAITTRHVHVNVAWRTPQFWLLWAVLCLNVSAGIGVLGMASPMLQEVFGGKLIGGEGALASLADVDKSAVATIAAGFLGLLSLANIVGRIGWASCSDRIGRRWTYFTFFGLGMVLYALAPFAGGIGSIPLFVSLFCVILTMYGGGFATIPAYLADLFGTQFVSAIHGRLLTAWSTAGILGPTLVNALRESQLERGVPAAQAYNVTMYVLAGLLVLGLICNALVRPVDPKHFMSDAELAALRPATGGVRSPEAGALRGRSPLAVGGAWLIVALPLGWGIWMTLQKTAQLFR